MRVTFQRGKHLGRFCPRQVDHPFGERRSPGVGHAGQEHAITGSGQYLGGCVCHMRIAVGVVGVHEEHNGRRRAAACGARPTCEGAASKVGQRALPADAKAAVEDALSNTPGQHAVGQRRAPAAGQLAQRINVAKQIIAQWARVLVIILR